MEARELLEQVADAYAKLESFEVEILVTSESGDEDAFSRSSQRTRAFFVAPDKVRIEKSGARGAVTVTNGIDHHHYFRFAKRYTTGSVDPRRPLPGSFRPEYPLTGGATFLFNQIAHKVASSKIIGEGPDEQIVSVTYEPPPDPGLLSSSPVTFSVATRTNLILRMEGDVTHRMPAHDETHSSRHICTYSHASLNQAIPAATFEYAPPADALDDSDPLHHGGRISAGGGGGAVFHGGAKNKRLENWHSTSWVGETLVEQRKMRIRDLDLSFERRLSFAGKELQISDTARHNRARVFR